MLIENDYRHCIMDAMRYSFANINDHRYKHEFYRDHFRAYGLPGLVEGWIEADYDLSIEEMSKLTAGYFYEV